MSNAIRAYTAGYVENYKDKLEYIVDFMRNNNDEKLSEERSCSVLCDILGKEGFNIVKDVSDIKDSFMATYGNKSPVVAYLCEYSSPKNSLSSCSKNFSSAINAGAAIGLKRAVGEIGGSVMVLGCPVSERSVHRLNMFDRGILNKVDAIICGHAADRTCESGTSLGSATIDFIFKGKEHSSPGNLRDGVNALSPCIMLFNLTEAIKAKYPSIIFINGIIQNGGRNVNTVPGETLCSFIVKGMDKDIIEESIEELKECAEFSSKFYGCELQYATSESQLESLKTHSMLSKIACHNLKERGIITIHGPLTITDGTDLGNISSKIPTIHPCIGICEDEENYEPNKFSEYTATDYAKENMLKAACALALTGVDVIQKPELLDDENVKIPINNRQMVSMR